MSDDEDEVVFTRRETAIHYGSLEEKESQRLASMASGGSLARDAIKAGMAAGNINVTQGNSSKVTEIFSWPLRFEKM